MEEVRRSRRFPDEKTITVPGTQWGGEGGDDGSNGVEYQCGARRGLGGDWMRGVGGRCVVLRVGSVLLLVDKYDGHDDHVLRCQRTFCCHWRAGIRTLI